MNTPSINGTPQFNLFAGGIARAAAGDASSDGVDVFSSTGERLTPQQLNDRQSDMALLSSLGSGECTCGNCSACLANGDPMAAFRARDAEVRQHENRHFAVAGEFATGPPDLQTVTLRNGKTFVINGKVHINMSAIAGNPKATAAKMRKLRDAALAPATPSGQDMSVAGQAAAKLAEAEAQIAEQSLRGQQGQSQHKPFSAQA